MNNLQEVDVSYPPSLMIKGSYVVSNYLITATILVLKLSLFYKYENTLCSDILRLTFI